MENPYASIDVANYIIQTPNYFGGNKNNKKKHKTNII